MRGKYNTQLSIAGINLNIFSDFEFFEDEKTEKLLTFRKSFETDEEAIDIRLTISSNNAEDLGGILYDPGDIWKMYRKGEYFNAVISYDSDEPIGIVSTAGDWKNISVSLNSCYNKQSGLLNTAGLELVVRAAIQFNKGAVFHSSGLDDNGKGVLFVGHSGEGKSTQSRLWQNFEGAMVFNEDRNAVRIIGEDVFCYGTPWGGTANIARNHKVPLSVIVMIEKSEENQIERMPVSEAVPKLIARSFFPYWDEKLSSLAISNILSIAAKVPVYKLSCKPTPDVVELVRSVL